MSAGVKRQNTLQLKSYTAGEARAEGEGVPPRLGPTLEAAPASDADEEALLSPVVPVTEETVRECAGDDVDDEAATSLPLPRLLRSRWCPLRVVLVLRLLLVR